MAMKTTTVILAMVFGLTGLLGCRPGNVAHVAPLRNYSEACFANLIEDCRKLAADGIKAGKEQWQKEDNLPATVAGLSPQFVEVRETEDVTVVDIQIYGGFRHFGYVVVCSSRTPDFVPRKSNWRVRKVAENVFEYSE
jgi:hypothetical protein